MTPEPDRRPRRDRSSAIGDVPARRDGDRVHLPDRRRDRPPVGPLQGRKRATPTTRWSSWSPTRWATTSSSSRRRSSRPTRPRCRSTCSARRPSSAGPRATWTTPTPRPSRRFHDLPGPPGARERRCSSRSACRSGTAATSTTSLDAGFGPYALSRLAGATGGIYFVTRLGRQPDGVRPGRDAGVQARLGQPRPVRGGPSPGHPLRQAVIDAAQITQQNSCPGMPALIFPPADGPEFKEAMAAQPGASPRGPPTPSTRPSSRSTPAAKLRDRETSRRWQAHYDLIRGRLLAMKVRCYEYNWACAG